MTGPRDPRLGREQTDASLADERNRTDVEIERRSEAAGETVDDVIRVARERAREVLELARRRADDLAPLSVEDIRARTAADLLLASEYELADLALREERERRRLAVRQLLVPERRTTDDMLTAERAAVDGAMVPRETLDMIVHDLRSMLTAVSVNAATMVLAVDGSAPVRTLVELAMGVQHASAQMDILLGDLQELAAIDSGRTQLRRADADVAEIVRTVLEINRAAAHASAIALTAELPEQPVIASLDAPRVLRVLMNLVTNALKFTPRGGRVSITLTRADGGIDLTVTDTGPGMPPELREASFEPYWQGPNANARGVGLGLYIARAIVQAHRGKLWIDSAPGPGATLRVHLPV